MFYGYGILNNHVPTLKATVMKGGVDTDALAFITAASITDVTQKSAINTLVTDLKTANIWSKMKAIYPFVGGTAAQHRFNLKSPGVSFSDFYLDFFGGGTHNSNGYLPNGNSYADTYLLPSTSLSQNSTHISYYANSDSNLGVDIGSRYLTGDSGILSLYIREGNTSYSRCNNVGSEFTVTNNTGTGMYVLSRIESNTYNYYKNNVKSIATKTSSGLPTRSITIGGLSINGAWSYGTKRCVFSSIGDGLTDTEAANFYTAVQAYQTTLGRAV